ncbi:hypothetical protein CVT24_001009 [Panaeolus cyanescens]|uniref:Ribonuclease H1 N-terminal domain-containing protein n=1 Tax=Panaeolus cyanescens TaxID=181874 RepID=A0A409YY54_9AGAR|nr:hypothetical protein CVT24_001009 [Panaeolus cyanescens]
MYLSSTAQPSVKATEPPQTTAPPTGNASAVSALRDRLHTMSLQSPGSPSKGARSTAEANNAPASSSKDARFTAGSNDEDNSTTMTSSDAAQFHEEFVDLKDIVWKLVKSNNRLKENSSTIKNDVSSLDEEVSSLRDEIRLLREETSHLRNDILHLRGENKELLGCQSALTDIISSLKCEMARLEKRYKDRHNPSASSMLIPPAFDANAERFYVVVKGRCPGVYTNLVWAQKMIEGLDPKVYIWQRVDGYKKAQAFYEEAERLQAVNVIERDFPNDGGVYGPIVPFVPWRQS